MAPASLPALTAFAQAFADPYAGARAFKRNGGRVVGYLSANAPVELVEAAGLYPVRIDGGGVSATPRSDAFMESLFDPTVRGVCERLLAGEFDFIDALILPRTVDSVQRLYYYLCEQQRNGRVKLPTLIFYDLLHTPFYSSAKHNLASLSRVRAALEAVAGAPIAEEALTQAIAVSNQRRELLGRCLAGEMSGVERLHVVAGAERMLASAFIAMASGLPEALQQRTSAPRARVVLVGNAPDDDRLHQAIEAAGCVVAGDFHDRDGRGLCARIDRSLPPMRALNEHHHRQTRSPRTFPSGPEALLATIEQRRADAVIFFYYAQEEVLTWDYPAQRDALDARGVESICLSAQPYQIDAAAITAATQELVASCGARA